jgi:hypothetical protein
MDGHIVLRSSFVARTCWLAVCYLLAMAAVVHSDSDETVNDLTGLYERSFRGSHDVHVPAAMYGEIVDPELVTTFALTGVGPLKYESLQGMFYFPTLSNEDDQYLYFYGYSGSSAPSPAKGAHAEALVFDKKTRQLKTIEVRDSREYERTKILGFYRTTKADSIAGLRIDTQQNAVQILASKNKRLYSILNPKDVDDGSDTVIMSRFQEYSSDFPYRQSNRDLEVLTYSGSRRSIVLDVVLPFSGSYQNVNLWAFGLQSVVDQTKIIIVMNPFLMDSSDVDRPTNPRRWNVLVYDLKGDILYSLWHGLNEADGMAPLSFSYFLGSSELYFEVLKKGKVEVYSVPIDFGKMRPMKEYETVDLLWSTRGLRRLWEQRIGEERSKNRTFSPTWR